MDSADILDRLDREEPLTTPEVARALDISQRAAWVYLSNLAEDDLVERQVGTDLQLDTWSLTEAGRSAADEDA